MTENTDLYSIVTRLAGSIERLEANIETLFKGMDRLSNYQQRPWQWGLVVSVFIGIFTLMGVFGTVLTLTVNPMKDEMARLSAAELRYRESTDEVLTMIADNVHDIQSDIEVAREAQRWLELHDANHENTFELIRSRMHRIADEKTSP